MQIEISAKEYRELLDIIHIADVVMSGHRREEDKRTERHRSLIQKVYALAEGEGLGGLVRYAESSKKYAPTHDFEHNTPAHVLIDEFGEHLFWDQLISRLVLRDAAQVAGGGDRLNAMNEHDRRHVEEPIRQKYIAEFAANGVANLALIERFGLGEGLPARTSD